MDKNAIVSSVKGAVAKTGFTLKKYSPEILVVGGIVGGIVSTVLACKATTKVDAVISEAKENVEKVHNTLKDEKFADKYTPEDGKKDLAIIYAQTGLKLAKLYGPAVILGVSSIASILASTDILRKRNAALGAAYAVVDKSFKEYRRRAVERYGEDVDKELRYGIKAKKIEEVETDPETGKEKKVKKTINVVDSEEIGEYARFFDESSREWTKDPEYNLTFLKAQQEWFNNRLHSTGHVFLNEVLDALDIPKTKAGQIVGWIYDPKKGLGDAYIDFGIYNVNREKNRDFVNGYERSILLDFNCQGPILNYI